MHDPAPEDPKSLPIIKPACLIVAIQWESDQKREWQTTWDNILCPSGNKRIRLSTELTHVLWQKKKKKGYYWWSNSYTVSLAPLLMPRCPDSSLTATWNPYLKAMDISLSGFHSTLLVVVNHFFWLVWSLFQASALLMRQLRPCFNRFAFLLCQSGSLSFTSLDSDITSTASVDISKVISANFTPGGIAELHHSISLGYFVLMARTS